jgi:phosphohistidine phosphatase SixA
VGAFYASLAATWGGGRSGQRRPATHVSRMEIVLFRHGEETSDALDPDLSTRGRERAERLGIYLPREYGAPDLLVAAASTRSSVRCFLTMRPLATSIGMRIWTQLRANQSRQLADALLSNASIGAKRVFVCWTHTGIPALAKALGGRRGEYPDPWEESTFDLVLHFTYRGRNKVLIDMTKQPF